MKTISILNPISNHYRKFKENQTLTKEQLNEFIDYFNDQDHLSRIGLSGVGIVSGFDVSLIKKSENDIKIQISQGYAITTDGDLLFFQKDISKLNKDKAPFINNDHKKFTHFKAYDNKKIYKPFYTDLKPEENNQITIWELKTKQESENAKPLKDFEKTLEGMVVILYLENYEKETDVCSINNCDNQGIEQIANLKVLLVPEEEANYMLNLDSLYKKNDWYKLYNTLPEIKSERVILNNSNAFSSIKHKYYNAIKESETIVNLVDGLDMIFNKFNKNLQKDFNVFNFSLESIPFDFQYRYDTLQDLVNTYNEIKDLLLNINVECCPNINSFSKHLFLGKLNSSEAIPPYNDLRHRFYKSSIVGNEFNNYNKVLNLLDRISLIITNYVPTAAQGNSSKNLKIKITPSVLNSLLGKQAIPYYYKVDNDFLKAWNFDKTKTFRQNYNLGYHNENIVKNPLLYQSDADFYRIEGHLGANVIESNDVINKIKNTKGLDFDCITFDLNNKHNKFTRFVKNNPSITHNAGVPKGGTFIMLSENDEVKADFYLSYKITKENDHGCCIIKECSYPWISSLKYLNNLSRSLKGTQSENQIMPRHYILHVIEYSINGVSLINKKSIIRIPLKYIFTRRMHAITEALNNRFNNGVIFDFNDIQKRLLIISAKDDIYKIKIQEVTLNPKNDIYSYSNKGLKKNDIPLKFNTVLCRNIRNYSSSFYNTLHKEMAPINKDDDYKSYKGKWEEWNILKKDLRDFVIDNKVTSIRQIKKIKDFPGDIQDIINDVIIKKIKEIFDDDEKLGNLTIAIDGDWVNENWVDSAMIKHYEKHKEDDVKDVVVSFINLRKELHNETKVTKLSIYIDTKYSIYLDKLINDIKYENYKKYDSRIDFFFEKPKGSNSIILETLTKTTK